MSSHAHFNSAQGMQLVASAETNRNSSEGLGFKAIDFPELRLEPFWRDKL
jgi:hypothetical protein